MCVAAAARGDDASWVGKSIVPTRRGVKIGHTGADGKVQYDAVLDADVYEVEEEKGDWIRVSQREVSGWLPKSEAILDDQAEAYFTERIRKDGKDDFACGLRYCIGMDDHLDAAIADLDQAIRLNPSDAVWFERRGQCWSAKRDADKALADFNEAIRLDPHRPGSFVGRAWAWSAKGEQERARADFDNAVLLDPKWSYVYVERGRWWLLLWQAERPGGPSAGLPAEKFDKAIADFDEGHQGRPP